MSESPTPSKPGSSTPPVAVRCEVGDWVEVEHVLLEPEERAAGLPPETAGKPLTMWVKGFAQGAAAMGEHVTLETMSGRLVSGRLFAVDPGYFHTFGRPIPQLVRVGRDLREQVARYRAAQAQAQAGGPASTGGSAPAPAPAPAGGSVSADDPAGAGGVR
jgi:hypothetical protein